MKKTLSLLFFLTAFNSFASEDSCNLNVFMPGATARPEIALEMTSKLEAKGYQEIKFVKSMTEVSSKLLLVARTYGTYEFAKRTEFVLYERVGTSGLKKLKEFNRRTVGDAYKLFSRLTERLPNCPIEE